MQGLDSQAESLNFTHKETLRISKHENNEINVAYYICYILYIYTLYSAYYMSNVLQILTDLIL